MREKLYGTTRIDYSLYARPVQAAVGSSDAAVAL